MSDTKTIEELILRTVNDSENGIPDTVAFFTKNKATIGEFNNMMGAISSLHADSMVVQANTGKLASEWILTEEGLGYVAKGSPEAQIFAAVPAEGIDQKKLMAQMGPMFKFGYNYCGKNRWLQMDKKTKTITRKVESITDTVKGQLQDIADGKEMNKKLLKDLKKRGMIKQTQKKIFKVNKGPKFALQRGAKMASDLTPEMIRSGDWKQQNWKPYNWDSEGTGLQYGALHPLNKVKAEVRSILLNMGFNEMPTNRFVESSFWNFDALFTPQQHPARDAHDTFFLKEPATCPTLPDGYAQRVRDAHEKGCEGSIGYRYDWKESEARKNILRTHTTAVSTRMLYDLANQKGGFKPVRRFSIDRVFRNETLDATHLAEFHQVEGFIADRNLTLGDLLGTIKEFFHQMGIDEVTFKPAYNPYTEPSMEIFVYSKELGKTIEIGNSGIFRPEMLLPMGLPEDVVLIAWGLSLERPTMIKYGMKNIRDLFGPKVKLPIIQNNPICNFNE